MKRSAMKPSAKGLSRSTPLRATKPMNRGTSTLKASKPMARGETPMKTRKSVKDKPKRAARENHAIRQSARGEECTMRIPGVCNRDPETTVWCHENSFAAGKGMGIKARCEHGAYGCAACHAVLDGQAPRPPGLTKEDVDVYFARGKVVSRQILERKGLLESDT